MGRLAVFGCLLFFAGCGKATPPEHRSHDLARACADLGRTDCEARLAARAAARLPDRLPSARPPGGFWASLRHPTRAEATTPAGRRSYWSHVADAQHGEPPTVDTSKVADLLPRLRAKLAEAAGLPESDVRVNVGVAAIRVTYPEGAMGALGAGRPAGYCAPALLAPVLMGETSRELLAADVRAVACTSNRCAGTYNLRPGSAGTLVLEGDACPGIDELLRADR